MSALNFILGTLLGVSLMLPVVAVYTSHANDLRALVRTYRHEVAAMRPYAMTGYRRRAASQKYKRKQVAK